MSVTLGEVFSSKLTPVDCRFDREIDGDLLENGVEFPQEVDPNDLRETRKLQISMKAEWEELIYTI